MTLKTTAQRALVRTRRRGALTAALRRPRPAGTTMVALGDSFVSGEPDFTTADTFVPIVAAQLGLHLLFSDGQGGTGYIRDAYSRADTFSRRLPDLERFHADVLLISGGYNDTWEMRKHGADAPTAATRTLELANGVAGRVIVVGPIWPRDEPIPAEAVTLAEVIEETCARLGFTFIDSIRVFEGRDRAAVIGADGTHPTLAGQALLAEHIVTAVRALEAQ